VSRPLRLVVTSVVGRRKPSVRAGKDPVSGTWENRERR
jgi:hypothetical protein